MPGPSDRLAPRHPVLDRARIFPGFQAMSSAPSCMGKSGSVRLRAKNTPCGRNEPIAPSARTAALITGLVTGHCGAQAGSCFASAATPPWPVACLRHRPSIHGRSTRRPKPRRALPPGAAARDSSSLTVVRVFPSLASVPSGQLGLGFVDLPQRAKVQGCPRVCRMRAAPGVPVLPSVRGGAIPRRP